MVNRSRNMRRGRGRMMRGGEQTQAEIDAAANNQKEGELTQAEIDAAANNQKEDSWYSSIPGAGALTGAVGSVQVSASSLFDDFKKETSTVVGDATTFASTGTKIVKNLLPGAAAPGAAAPGAAAPGSVVAPGPPQDSLWGIFNGGRRRSRQMRMKGGRGLGLDYYATPVNGIKVAQPTYMEYYKGGKRRRTCKRRRSCKRRTCKRHRRR